MISVSGLSKSFAGRTLFEDVSFTLGKNEILGLVGRNGCGKSTLTKILLGLEEADKGDVTQPRGYQIGHLDQHIQFTKPTLLEETCLALPEERLLEHYLAEKVLFGLGFTQKNLDKDPWSFSGGYQLRINLAKCLLAEPHLLILDEPTNYLDILSLQWMKEKIKKYKGEVILITHDRSFMNHVVTHVAGIHRKTFKKVKGNTDQYYFQVKQNEEIFEKTRGNQERKKQELEKFVDRFRAKASKASQAQSKLKQLEKMEPLEKLSEERRLGFKFQYKSTHAKTLMSIAKLSFGFEPSKPLIQNLEFEIKAHDRIGIIGKNGKGKTTLLNLLAGQLPLAKETELKSHPDLLLGYYQQTNRKNLLPDNTIEDEIAHENPKLSLTQTRQICGAMMFSGDDAKKKIKVLSGGEQSRVLLGKVIAKPSNLLLLDEPTNHLDMESIASLIKQVKAFPGPILFVTHDEDFLTQVATKLIYFKKDQTEFFPYDYPSFLEKIGWTEEPLKSKKPTAKEKTKTPPPSRLIRPIERAIEKLENKIMELESKIEGNQAFLSGDWDKDQEIYECIKKDQNKIEQLFADLEKENSKLESLC